MASRRAPLRRLLGPLLVWLFVALPLAADTLLVVPFDNTNRTAELDWVGESFAESLTAGLMGNGHGLVTRDERLAALERMGLPFTAPLTRASLLRLGEEVGADWIVLGRFTVQDDRLRVGVQMLDVRKPALSPWMAEEGPFAGLLVVQRQLAWRILYRLDNTFPVSLRDFQEKVPPLRVSAFESYIRGLLTMNREHQRHYFFQAYRLQPDYAPALFRLALLSFDEQDYAGAASWLDKIPATDPLAVEAGFYLSLCYYFQDNFAEAAQALAPVAQRFPTASVWNNLGVFASHQERTEDAVDYFSRALADDPADADACFNLGLHHARRGDWPAAARILERCTSLNPGDDEALLLYAHVLDQLGRRPEAVALRRQAGREDDEFDSASLDADRLQQRFNVPQSAAGAPVVSSARARHVEVHLERGQDFLARSQFQDAINELTEAIMLDPASARAHYVLARVYARQGRLQDSVSELKASLWGKDTVDARLRLAEIYLAWNQAADARKEINAALALDPGSAEARSLSHRIPMQTADTPAEESNIQ